MTITHGVLTGMGGIDSLIHEMDDISEFDVQRKVKKIDWSETQVFDNSNHAKVAIYKEKWK